MVKILSFHCRVQSLVGKLKSLNTACGVAKKTKKVEVLNLSPGMSFKKSINIPIYLIHFFLFGYVNFPSEMICNFHQILKMAFDTCLPLPSNSTTGLEMTAVNDIQ